jgi:hypothetical protein
MPVSRDQFDADLAAQQTALTNYITAVNAFIALPPVVDLAAEDATVQQGLSDIAAAAANIPPPPPTPWFMGWFDAAGKESVVEARKAIGENVDKLEPLFRNVEMRLAGIVHDILDRLDGTTLTLHIPPPKAKTADPIPENDKVY